MIQKIKSQKEIFNIVKNLRLKGKKIVTFNGSFDILHDGHTRSFQEAKKQGDILIILLNSDSSVYLYKGKERPIHNEKKRAYVLSAIDSIDYVVLFSDITPIEILGKIKPHIHCNGSDWGKNCVERAVVEKSNGKIHVLKWQKGFSTTKLISKMSAKRATSARAVFLDRDGTINYNNPEHLYKKEDFRFTPYAIKALQKLSQTDYKIIIITNQSGIGRGFFKESDLKILNSWLIKECKSKKIRIDKIYYCLHHPKDNCVCRKPKIGMLIKAAKDYDISLNKSWFIGDDQKDIIAGRKVNIKTIKLGNKMAKDLKLEPDYYAENLLSAINIILKK